MTSDGPLRLAILGDVHGHLTLGFRVLRRWQDETGHTLDVILQVGDLGAFPPPFRLDDATRRFAERDPDELGFAHYHEGGAEAAEIFGPDALPARALAAQMWFIKGNHEDFEFLVEVAAARRRAGAGRPAQRASLHIPGGRVVKLARRDRTLRIAALGGIADDGKPGRDPVSVHYTATEVRALRRAMLIDVLLSTHETTRDGPRGDRRPASEVRGGRVAERVAECCLRLGRPRRRDQLSAVHYHEHRPAPRDGRRRAELPSSTPSNFLRADRLNAGLHAPIPSEWNDTQRHARRACSIRRGCASTPATAGDICDRGYRVRCARPVTQPAARRRRGPRRRACASMHLPRP